MSKLIVERGEVYYSHEKNRKVSVAQEELLVFACTADESTKNKRRTASSLNCMPQSARIGITKTLERVSERFYWKGMVADVRDMVSHNNYILPLFFMPVVYFNKLNCH